MEKTFDTAFYSAGSCLSRKDNGSGSSRSSNNERNGINYNNNSANAPNNSLSIDTNGVVTGDVRQKRSFLITSEFWAKCMLALSVIIIFLLLFSFFMIYFSRCECNCKASTDCITVTSENKIHLEQGEWLIPVYIDESTCFNDSDHLVEGIRNTSSLNFSAVSNADQTELVTETDATTTTTTTTTVTTEPSQDIEKTKVLTSGLTYVRLAGTKIFAAVVPSIHPLQWQQQHQQKADM